MINAIRLNIILSLLSMLVSLPAYTQEVYTTVELLDKNDATSVFYAEGRGYNENDALENARINVLRKIIYEGVEGFNDGKPLLHSTSSSERNDWLKNLFTGKVATYKNFLGDIELVGDFDRDGSTYICNANVMIKHRFLKRQIDMQVNGVSTNNTSTESPQQQPAPSHRWSVH